ncbi:hypothetical protein KSP39_PZI021430 [Platanthera zijinensis]|uniref:Ubiquitin-like domain-containing protein n=1 Tax=Platanthera zijinensis TaxID=2320716 RepID=A0AAP0AWS7_9ASPA
MDIVIQTPDGLCFKMREIWYFTTVLQIKEMIHKTYGIPVSSNTLSFNGVIMEDGLQIHNYGLIENSRVLLHLCLPEPGPEILHNINPGGAAAGSPAQAPFPVTAPTSPAGTVMLDVEIYADDNVSQLWEELYCIVFKQAVMKEDRSFRWHGVRSGDLIQIISGPRHE